MKKLTYSFPGRGERKISKLRMETFKKDNLEFYKRRKLILSSVMLLSLIVVIAIFIIIVVFVDHDLLRIVLIFLLNISIYILFNFKYSPVAKIFKKYEISTLPDITKEMIVIANTKTINYYKIPKDYKLFKCYYSTNNYFSEKDLIVYFYEFKLRITNDLFNSLEDHGCYELRKWETKVSYKYNDSKAYTLLTNKEITFVLDAEAKEYIEAGFNIN